MSDAPSHRGADPRDRADFDPSAWPRLRAAVADFSWLRSRDYAEPSALKLVGDRHALTARQRMAVFRSACSDAALARRKAHQGSLDDLRGQPLSIDGFNVLTTIEAALGGAVILSGRDGCYRDLAGVHGTYRKVEETLPALRLVGAVLATRGVGPCLWLFDRPVSNSGRLSALTLKVARGEGWDWQVALEYNPDAVLIQGTSTVATADSAILDQCTRWVALAKAVIEADVPGANLVDLAPTEPAL
jgi:hypothetical protein